MKQITNFTRVFKPSVLKKAREVNVNFVSATEARDDDGDKYTLVHARCRGETVARKVELHLYGNTPNAKCWVTCTCEWFLYVCEVSVKQKDSTDIIHSNGAKPKVTNPSMVPCACKHILACLLQGALDLKPKPTSVKPAAKPSKPAAPIRRPIVRPRKVK